jgi:hypothetical protein
MRKTWLFQANPKHFDIDAFLATKPHDFLWLAKHSADKMVLGDQVFVWRAVAGGDKELSGVIAETEIIEEPAIQPDDPASAPYWLDQDGDANPTIPQQRVRLGLVRVATNRKEIVRREWAQEDPILRRMTIIIRRVGTNFLLEPEQADRIGSLWTKTGRAFSYAESVAGLWAYEQTYQQEVSKLPGSVVAEIALTTGRAITSIYNKVMNFRHVDPRDTRKGFSGGGDGDDVVWRRFFDTATQTIRANELREEYQRLWVQQDVLRLRPIDFNEAREEVFQREASSLAQLTLAALMERYSLSKSQSGAKPRATPSTLRGFERSPIVVAIAKVRAGFKCEVPSCQHPTFMDSGDRPYCETHHIEPLAEGGDDDLENVACLCPAHHREAHHGKAAKTIRVALESLRRLGEIEPLLSQLVPAVMPSNVGAMGSPKSTA